MKSPRTTNRTTRTQKQTYKTEPNIEATSINPANAVQRKKYILRARTYSIELGQTTKILGIINATPDSFSRDGQYGRGLNHQKAIRYARNLIRQGADILDVGGESTRPGAEEISVTEEIKRVVPVIEALASTVTVPISVDTFKPEVAREAFKAGASILNTIKGCRPEKKILNIVKEFDAAIILMHMRGTPRTMQKNPFYADVMDDIFKSLKKSKEKCLENGIKSDKIVIDPGIGFGKTIRHNLMILNRLGTLTALHCPVLVGTSRKNFIGKILNRDVHQRLPGTIASVSAAVMNGAHLVRVHDVSAIKEAVTLTDAIINEHEK